MHLSMSKGGGDGAGEKMLSGGKGWGGQKINLKVNSCVIPTFWVNYVVPLHTHTGRQMP